VSTDKSFAGTNVSYCQVQYRLSKPSMALVIWTVQAVLMSVRPSNPTQNKP
jgi:hypothetical protein